MTFPDEGSGTVPTDEISFRDVTSPINPDDYTVPCPTSSGTSSHTVHMVATGQGKVREIQGQGKVREFCACWVREILRF